MDSRLRTLPFLPLAERPDVITATSGKQIVVDKKKREGGERIMNRGRVSVFSLSMLLAEAHSDATEST